MGPKQESQRRLIFPAGRQMLEKKRSTVLMTTPSLDRAVNVSGVATVVSGIISHFDRTEWEFRTVIIGKNDKLPRGFAWALGQIGVPFRFAAKIILERPRIVHVHGPLNSLAICRDCFLLFIASFFPVRRIYHIHGGEFISAMPSSPLLRWAISNLLSRPEAVLVLGDQEAIDLSNRYGVDPKKVTVLPNAVDLPQKPVVRTPSHKLRVLSLGRLSPEKGLDVLCAAMEEGDHLQGRVSLKLFGAGPLERDVVSRLSSSMGSNFFFGGVAQSAERDAAYRWADVLIMPSLRGEGLPMVLLEAMSMGVVPIATRDGMIPDALIDGETGFAIEKQSPSSIVDGLTRAMQAKAYGTLAIKSANAYNLIKEKHSIESYNKKLQTLYEKIV